LIVDTLASKSAQIAPFVKPSQFLPAVGGFLDLLDAMNPTQEEWSATTNFGPSPTSPASSHPPSTTHPSLGATPSAAPRKNRASSRSERPVSGLTSRPGAVTSLPSITAYVPSATMFMLLGENMKPLFARPQELAVLSSSCQFSLDCRCATCELQQETKRRESLSQQQAQHKTLELLSALTSSLALLPIPLSTTISTDQSAVMSARASMPGSSLQEHLTVLKEFAGPVPSMRRKAQGSMVRPRSTVEPHKRAGSANRSIRQQSAVSTRLSTESPRSSLAANERAQDRHSKLQQGALDELQKDDLLEAIIIPGSATEATSSTSKSHSFVDTIPSVNRPLSIPEEPVFVKVSTKRPETEVAPLYPQESKNLYSVQTVAWEDSPDNRAQDVHEQSRGPVMAYTLPAPSVTENSTEEHADIIIPLTKPVQPPKIATELPGSSLSSRQKYVPSIEPMLALVRGSKRGSELISGDHGTSQANGNQPAFPDESNHSTSQSVLVNLSHNEHEPTPLKFVAQSARTSSAQLTLVPSGDTELTLNSSSTADVEFATHLVLANHDVLPESNLDDEEAGFGFESED
jgi:hypothetical protein